MLIAQNAKPLLVWLLRHWPLVLIVVVWIALFWQMNTGQTVVGFRDTAYLYYPLFQSIDQQWAAGQIPLWNPLCDLGHPVVGDGTSSVFYPGKLIFLLRFLEYHVRFGWYISLHVLLAAINCYLLSLRLRASHTGAGLAAFAYAFGGSVLFQTVNVVYLVSAAWLPLAMMFVLQMFRRRGCAAAVRAGIAGAMMILGGDPQMAYVIALVAVGLLLWRQVFHRRLAGHGMRAAILKIGIARLSVMAATMFLLAAIQILPTWVWSQQSVRANPLNSAESRAHENATYEFSQPPWSLAELIFPNISGKPFPINRRWTDQFPAADRMWTPSIYVGLVTLILAVGAIRFRGPRRRQRFLTVTAIFFGIGSFGWYGPVWLIEEIAGGFGQDKVSDLPPWFGGLYWLMTVMLPKFAMFRYPAKLFVVTSLMICVLAGTGLQCRRSMRSSAWPMLVALACVVFLLVLQFTGTEKWFRNPSGSAMFGPLDLEGAQKAIQNSLIHSLIASTVLVVLYSRSLRAAWPALLFSLAIVEVLTANHWLVPQIASKHFSRPSWRAPRVESDELVDNPRLHFAVSQQVMWYLGSSPRRLTEIIDWQRRSLHPKHHLASDVGLVGSFSSIEHPTNMRFRAHLTYGGLVPEGTSLILEMEKTTFWINGTISQRWHGGPVDAQLDLTESVRVVTAEPHDRWSELSINALEFMPLRDDCAWQYDNNESGRVALTVECDRPTDLLYSTLPCSGWRVNVVDLDRETELADARIDAGDFFLGARLPAGRFRVTFEYWPLEFWIGLWVSVASWIGLAAWAAAHVHSVGSSRNR